MLVAAIFINNATSLCLKRLQRPFFFFLRPYRRLNFHGPTGRTYRPYRPLRAVVARWPGPFGPLRPLDLMMLLQVWLLLFQPILGPIILPSKLIIIRLIQLKIISPLPVPTGRTGRTYRPTSCWIGPWAQLQQLRSSW